MTWDELRKQINAEQEEVLALDRDVMYVYLNVDWRKPDIDYEYEAFDGQNRDEVRLNLLHNQNEWGDPEVVTWKLKLSGWKEIGR